MKKIYTLSVALLAFVFFNSSYGQYTATRTGNWSNTVTWAPGALPAANCNNCTITIDAGITVTLDAAVILRGTSKLILNTNAKLIIPNSGNNLFATHNTITLEPPSATITVSTGAVIDASGAGPFDGVFNTIPELPTLKLIGSPAFGFSSTLGTTLSGPVSVNSSGTLTPLPVVLTDFNAVLAKGAIDISWVTSIEINTDHFNVQRSIDGSAWNVIGTVKASGNSTESVSYSFVDPTPVAAINYYRLQSVDKDGKYGYSEIKIVRGSLITGYSVFPNPAKEYVNVTLSSTAPKDLTIRLVNQLGQVLQEQKVTNGSGTNTCCLFAIILQARMYCR